MVWKKNNKIIILKVEIVKIKILIVKISKIRCKVMQLILTLNK